MDQAARIPVDDMMSLMTSGEATALLGEYDVGPTWYAGTWWHVPRGELDEGFVPADAESTHQYYEMFVRLAVSSAILTEQVATDPPEVDDLEPVPVRPGEVPTVFNAPDWSDAGERR